MIAKTPHGTYVVKSKDGTRLLGGPYKTHDEAKARLAQVEMFKKAKKRGGY